MSMNLHLRQAGRIEIERFAVTGIVPAELGLPVAESSRADGRTRLAGGLGTARPGLRGPASEPSSPLAVMRRQADERLEALRRLHGVAAKPAATGNSPPPRPEIDLGEAWHVLHYALAGQAWTGPMPAATLLAGGCSVGRDLGYGAARLLEPVAVEAFARYLAPLDVPVLAMRLDLPRMRRLGIYRVDSVDPGTLKMLRDDLGHQFPIMKGFVQETARAGDGLLIWMT